MARQIILEPARTLKEFRLLPGLTSEDCAPERVDLSTLVAARVPTAEAGQSARARAIASAGPPSGAGDARAASASEPAAGLRLSIPFMAAAMQAVSGPALGIALARAGGLACVYCSQAAEQQAAMVAQIKAASVAERGAEPGVDATGRLLAAAALNTHDYQARAPLLVAAGADLLVLDSSDGHSVFQARCLQWLAQRCPGVPVMAGNVVTAQGFDYLAQAGAAAVKVGMGSGSICITQEVKGTGRGLATAVHDVVAARDAWAARTGRYLPVVADGGLVDSRDVIVALALGADAVMMGRFFAAMDEAPGALVDAGGRRMKQYWGEGSERARAFRGQRYGQTSFVEGVDGLVDASGPLAAGLSPMLAKLRSALSSCGCATIAQLHREARLELVSALSFAEGQVHDVYLPPPRRRPARRAAASRTRRP